MTTDTEPPSNPEFDNDDTRKIVLKIAAKQQRQDGASTVWRLLGGIAVTAALTLAGWGLVYAQQAAVDHERVDQLEDDYDAVRADLQAMRTSLEEMARAMARIEGRLERED